MEPVDSFEPMTKARLGATPTLTGDRLLGGPTHQATRFAGGV